MAFNFSTFSSFQPKALLPLIHLSIHVWESREENIRHSSGMHKCDFSGYFPNLLVQFFSLSLSLKKKKGAKAEKQMIFPLSAKSYDSELWLLSKDVHINRFQKATSTVFCKTCRK